MGHYEVEEEFFHLCSASVILQCLVLSWKTSFFPSMTGQCLIEAKNFVHLLHGMASPITCQTLMILCAINGPTNPLTIFTFPPPWSHQRNCDDCNIFLKMYILKKNHQKIEISATELDQHSSCSNILSAAMTRTRYSKIKVSSSISCGQHIQKFPPIPS